MKTPKSVQAALSPKRPKILGREMAAFTGCHLLALQAISSPVIRMGGRKPVMLDYAAGIVLCSMKGIEAHALAEGDVDERRSQMLELIASAPTGQKPSNSDIPMPDQLRRLALEVCDLGTPSQLLEAGTALVKHINAGLGVSPSKSSKPAAQEDGSTPDPTPATPSPASA